MFTLYINQIKKTSMCNDLFSFYKFFPIISFTI